MPHAKDALTRAIDELVAQHKALDKQIAALRIQAPELAATKALQKVPGIGPVTAAGVVSRLCGGRLAHPGKFVAWTSAWTSAWCSRAGARASAA